MIKPIGKEEASKILDEYLRKIEVALIPLASGVNPQRASTVQGNIESVRCKEKP
jgi:hypothetical protein